MTSFVENLASAVLTQLHDVRGLCSLQLQNHIYGCYILMQDIATSQVSHTGTTVTTDTHSFDYKKGFGEIGLRYGFLMDTKLELGTWLPRYESVWLDCFAALAASHDVNVVDTIEDAVNTLILRVIPKEDGFFRNAMEQEGTLTYEWVDKALQLLRGTSGGAASAGETETTHDKSSEDDVVPSNDALSHAHIEKPITHHRRLDTTRRHKERHEDAVTAPAARKTHLAKTRKQRHREEGTGKN